MFYCLGRFNYTDILLLIQPHLLDDVFGFHKLLGNLLKRLLIQLIK